MAPYTSSLHEACSCGDLDGVKDFLAQGFDMNARNGEGYTPLEIAVTHCEMDIVKYILEVLMQNE